MYGQWKEAATLRCALWRITVWFCLLRCQIFSASWLFEGLFSALDTRQSLQDGELLSLLLFRPQSACCLCKERGVSDLGSEVSCGFQESWGLFIEFHTEQGFSFSALLSRRGSIPRRGRGWAHGDMSHPVIQQSSAGSGMIFRDHKRDQQLEGSLWKSVYCFLHLGKEAFETVC